jgi:endonuclease/exonuclease/phosphatase family metal-dependent hydrolase
MTRQWPLATFNIETLDFKPSRAAGFEARRIALRPLLQRINADVLCLQEVNAQKIPRQKDRGFAALDMLLCDTQHTNFYRATGHDPDTGSASDVHNLVILSRWPMSNKRQLHHDLVPPLASPFTEDVLRWDRPVQMTDLTLPDGRTLNIVNLHLRAPRAVPSHAANKMAQPAHGSEE